MSQRNTREGTQGANVRLSETKPIFLSADSITKVLSESFTNPSYGHCTWQTLFSAGLTQSDSLTAGIATCPPQTGYLAHHRHEQAEIYFILDGEGIMRVEDAERNVAKGDVVFVPRNAEHGIRNSSLEGRNLVWFYCFAADRFEDVRYRFLADVKAKL